MQEFKKRSHIRLHIRGTFDVAVLIKGFAGFVDCLAAFCGVVELVLVDVVVLFAGQEPEDFRNAVAALSVNLIQVLVVVKD